jgi:putative membrane protein
MLARDRTILANERTVLSYVRTTIMLLVSSVSLLKLFPDNNLALWGGALLIPLAVLMAILGGRRFFVFSRSLRRLKSS